VLATLVDAVAATQVLKRRIGRRRWGLPSLPLPGLPFLRIAAGLVSSRRLRAERWLTLIAVAVEASESHPPPRGWIKWFGPGPWANVSEANAASAEMFEQRKPGMKEFSREEIQGRRVPAIGWRQADRRRNGSPIDGFGLENESSGRQLWLGRHRAKEGVSMGWRCRRPGLCRGSIRLIFPFQQGWGRRFENTAYALPAVLPGACEGVQLQLQGVAWLREGFCGSVHRISWRSASNGHGRMTSALKTWQCCLDPDGAGPASVPGAVSLPQQRGEGQSRGEKGGHAALQLSLRSSNAGSGEQARSQHCKTRQDMGA